MKKIFAFFIAILIIICGFDFSQEDYLWLEFDKETKHADGSITQSLFIRYGQFPHKRKNFLRLDKIEAFYTSGKKDKNGKSVFYKLNINTKDGKSYIKVNSRKADWCMMLVRAEKKEKNIKYNYIAKTSFFISSSYNNSAEERGGKRSPIIFDNINKGIDIKLFREQIKKFSTYYRRRSFPIRGIVTFANNLLRNKEIDIINEAGNVERLKTDKKGNFLYIPKNIEVFSPERKKSFEQDLIIVKHSLGDIVYKSSYTILFKHINWYKKSDFNFQLGIVIFMASAVITTLIFAKIIEKRFKL